MKKLNLLVSILLIAASTLGAQQLSAKAQEFSERAAYLATQPATIESKQGIGCNCTSHYRYFSKIYSQQAREFEQKAAQEEEVVRKLGGASSPRR